MTPRADASEHRRKQARDDALKPYENGHDWANALWIKDALWGVDPMLAISRAKRRGDYKRAAFIERLAYETGYWSDP